MSSAYSCIVPSRFKTNKSFIIIRKHEDPEEQNVLRLLIIFNRVAKPIFLNARAFYALEREEI